MVVVVVVKGDARSSKWRRSEWAVHAGTTAPALVPLPSPLATDEADRVRACARAMVLVLAIGDFYIPHRCGDIPARFRELLVPGKIQHVLCTGNLCCKCVEEFLRRISPDVHVARGEFDDAPWPERVVVTVGQVSFGLCHGHQVLPWCGDGRRSGGGGGGGDAPRSLAALRRDMGVDVLVAGNARRLSIERGDESGGLVVRPGSATGAPAVTDPWLWDDGAPAAAHADGDGAEQPRNGGSDGVEEAGDAAADGRQAHQQRQQQQQRASSSAQPSFVLMDVQGSKIVTYSYVLDAADCTQVKVERAVFEKPGAAAAA